MTRLNKELKSATSSDMLNAQELWRSVFSGNAYWNTKKTVSLRLATAICTEVARDTVKELKSEITGSVRADYLNEQYKRIKYNLRITTEKLLAGGMIIFRSFVLNDNIYVSVLSNDMFVPLRYNEIGELESVLFIDSFSVGNKYYTLIERCDFQLGTYTIEYTAYRSGTADSIGKEIPLSDVPRWEHLPEILEFKDQPRPWFVVLNMPNLNHIDFGAPEGVAIFSKAIDMLREADKQFERLLWEFEGGELAIDASSDLVMRQPIGDNGYKFNLPKNSERLFRFYDAQDSDKFGIKVFNPDFRDESINRGLDMIFKRIEFLCGLSYGIISDPRQVERTATEVLSSKQRYYSTIIDIQSVLEKSLISLIDVIDLITTAYSLAPTGSYEVGFQWDDSIISDRNTEFAERMQLLSAGVISHAEMRSWYMGVPLDSDMAQAIPGVIDYA